MQIIVSYQSTRNKAHKRRSQITKISTPQLALRLAGMDVRLLEKLGTSDHVQSWKGSGHQLKVSPLQGTLLALDLQIS